MPELKIVDMERLADVADGEAEGMRHLAHAYVVSIRGHFKKLEQALKSGRNDQVSYIAHTAAGASAMVGMEVISEAFRELERLGDANNVGKGTEHLRDARRAFQDVCRFLSGRNLISGDEDSLAPPMEKPS